MKNDEESDNILDKRNDNYEVEKVDVFINIKNIY